MKKFTLFLVGAALTASFTASANVVINVPENVSVLVVNMANPDIENSLFSGKKLTLSNGENQILFKYIPTFESSNEIRNVSSEVVVAKFNISDTELDFKLPKYRSMHLAKEKIHDLDWGLIDAKTNQAIPVKYDYLSKNGLQYGRDYIAEAREYNLAQGAAAIELLTKTIAPVVKAKDDKEHSTYKVHSSSNTFGSTSANLEQLKAWYRKSSEQERKAFRKWIVDQE